VRNPHDLVSRMQDFCGFLAVLGGIPPQVLTAPMAEGKWSVQEVVAHIMAYDEAFLQSVVLAIEDGRQPLVPDPADNQSFNDRAAALGRNLTEGQLLERATLARRQLVNHLRRLPAEAFRTKRQGLPESDLAELLDKDFVSHDRIHVKRIQEYLKDGGYLSVSLPSDGTAH
jgi:hypothetical protein